ncbi:hypothetical protein M378DRAFT_74092 [Amanita muscaria Koide BX008]|uniref:HAT C-terminal dimerisation domain-containing protein n=1 Tax=Amanita muscaria (strain Koide BX008) TaxID=946122 RepID=A0A0C2SVH4_AMAMK|nr:hypothetical protein M378DRAFT_74092 [Amanita muscaria Koide BX008]
MSEWEDLLEKPEYEPVHKGLQAGVALLEKYYHRADDTDIYFIAHVLDPTLKLVYLSAAWDDKYLEVRIEGFKSQVSLFHSRTPSSSLTLVLYQRSYHSRTWSSFVPPLYNVVYTSAVTDPFEEFHQYLRQPRLKREDCPNPIPWWGHQSEYPVLWLMARDYLAIPATTCIAERSFSLSARTNDPQR